jgi:uncharacterized protein YjiS (DUF1127 family)
VRSNFFDFEPYRLTSVCSPGRQLLELLQSVPAEYRCWRDRIRQRRELTRLDRATLRDIGVTPSEAQYEWQKPFWRA